MKKCPKDNSTYEDNFQYCRNCGTLLVEGTNEKVKCFLIEMEQDQKRVFELSPTEVCTIGRLPENTIIPQPEKYISRYHARIVFEDGKFVLYDGGIDAAGIVHLSSSGVFVNRRRGSRFVLANGCEIRFGQTTFIYREKLEN